jgi:NADPH:quinone reductase-like Zn-dependent oxidoreductase
MQAIVYTEYGPPEKLQLQEVAKPTPQDHQVLVKVYAASANPLDWHRMRGTPFLAHLSEGLINPKVPRLGADLAGVVEAVGQSVTQFRPGDAVFGNIFAGSFAEYACASETALVLKPANLSFEEAAATPVAALTALQGVRDKGHIQAGQKVLVNGASGGVGSFAVQLAKSFGAEVTGVCSTRNVEMVRSLGADYVIDYTQQDFAKNNQSYDLIFDVAANHSVAEYKRVLTPHGICVMAGFSNMRHLAKFFLAGTWVSKTGPQKIGMMGTVQTNQKDLLTIKELLEAGKIKPVSDRSYSLKEVPDAIRYLEEGHARGKVIITIASPK